MAENNMKQTAILTFISILLLAALAACANSAQMTPTPFPPTWTPGPALVAQQAFPVEIAELLAEPETYDGVYVQVTGRYQKRPLLVCESESATHNAAATWDLLDNSNLSLAAGEFDQALRSLVPDGLTMTVAGYWQLWEGQVGCGKQAVRQQMWFLEVTDVVSPRPIAQVTLTPGSPEGQPPFSEELVTPDPSQGVEDPSGGILPPTPTEMLDVFPTDEGFPPQNATETAVSGEFPPNPNPTSSAAPDGSVQTATPATTGQATRPAATGTATSTGGSGTGTPPPTATGSAGNATPTRTPSGQSTPISGNIVPKDELIEEDIGIELLGTNEIHEWTLDLVDSTVVTVSLAAEPHLNLGLEIRNQGGTVISQSKQAGANQIETIRMLSVDPEENYTIRVVNEASSGEGGYALSIWGNLEDSFMLDARGILAEGQVGSATIPEGFNAVHLWFFQGQMGDTISITTNTDDAHLITVSFLFDPEGNDILDFSQEDIELPASGLYTMGLWEDGGEEADYTVSYSQQ